MKTVLFFTHFLNAGGAEKVVRRLVGYINSHDFGFCARECVVFDDPDYHDEVPDPIVLKSKSKPGDNKVVRGINVLKQIRELKHIKREIKADLCISFLPGADIINVLSRTGEKRLVSVRNKESFFVHDPFRRLYVKYAYDHCDRIVTVSDVVKRVCIDFFGAKEELVTTIRNAIEDTPEHARETISAIRPDVEEFMSGSRIIITAGRLNFQKGQDHLIRAFAHLIKDDRFLDCKLLILGKGELMDDLNALAVSCGVSDRVMLTGSIHGPANYIRRSDVFVLSSLIEGIPNVLLEAMQCGTPCISTECGSRELLAPDTDPMYMTDSMDTAEYGILIPLCEEHRDFGETQCSATELIMSDAIARMLTDDDLKQSYINKGYEYIKEYTPKRIFGQWVKVIDNLLRPANNGIIDV